MARTRLTLITLALLGALGPAAAAQQKRPAAATSPAAVAQAALSALARQDATGFARYVDPAAKTEFQQTMLAQLHQAATAADTAEVKRAFPGTNSLAELDQLPADRFFLRFLQGAAQAQRPAGVTLNNRVLGVVMEGDTLAHAVYRSTLSRGSDSISRIDVASLRRSAGTWRLLLTGQLGGGPTS